MVKDELIEEIINLIIELFKVNRRASYERWQKLDLTMPQMKALMLLACKGEIAVGKLAEVLGVKASNITFILDQLEGKGLIERKQKMGDRRVVLGSLTEKGKNLLENIGQRKRDYWRGVLSNLTTDEARKAREGLEIILDKLRRRG
jgi:DNA-binding MarR family transcriptional regulator